MQTPAGEPRMTDYKICATPRCPIVVEAGTPHCTHHTRAREQARGTAHQRGYDNAHRKLRAQWKPLVEAGRVNCWRCRQPIQAHEAWHLGHDDNNREAYRGPEHEHCNTRSAGLKK